MNRRRALLVMATLAMAWSFSACGETDSATSPAPLSTGSSTAATGADASAAPFTARTLIEAFSRAGFDVEVRRPKGFGIYGTSAGRTDLLIGAWAVQVNVFPSEAVAKKAVAGVSADGTSIKGLELYEFIGPEHVFARGRIIVLYVESDPRRIDRPVRVRDARVLEVLESLMGPQFAGQGLSDVTSPPGS
jgi:hypothetical protein